MIAINLPNVKNCMAHLLLKETFDSFLFIEGEIVTANTFTIDGFIQKKFYDDSPSTSPDNSNTISDSIMDYASWKELREYCLSIIKGKRTPLSFKFIFNYSPDMIQKLIATAGLDLKAEDVQGLYLNIRFDGEHLICITGTSFKSFTLDKTLEKAWDAYVQQFFEEHGIEYAQIEG